LRYVLDCSVAVKWFVPEALSDVAERVLERYEAQEISFAAPRPI
jgi:predicted nucleic acid-binding protein